IEVRRRRDPGLDPEELSYADWEGEMGGHPWITYNKGRIGWGYDDYRRYAPESREPVRLRWLAVSRELATFVSVDGLEYDALLDAELGGHRETFDGRLESKGLDPEAYRLLPVHEWQWDEAIVGAFAKEVATDAIVPLGAGPDEYLPMQSIRTFANVDRPDRHNVKLPMRILNTLVWRGLPGERTEAAPLVTEYLKGIRDDDPFLREEHRLVLPGEIAGVNVDHPEFDRLDGGPYQYRELLGCVWRESVQDLIAEDERPITLSALLHVDGTGTPVLSRLVERSGLSLEEWLGELFSTLLPPLLHYLYRYGTVFSPHGENTILVLREGVPTRLALKDFVDDVNVSEHPLPEIEALPTELRDVLRTEPPEGLSQFVFAGLFVGVLRYVAEIAEEHHDSPEERFYRGVRETILAYQSRFPELQERFELFDLLKPTFTKLCLNRNRMLGGYGDADGRPHAAEHGAVRNALYEVARDDDRAKPPE
ncbi:MAG: IucA/IucC family siderophore biosynthesis protein, partial [Halalkalicoccus sp.]